MDFNNYEIVRQGYYWILATKDGRTVVLGAYDTEEDANRIGFEKLEGGFEVVELPTRDIAKATKMLKYRKFDQTSKLEEAIKRAKHKI